jgi:hypothetical protein
MRRLPDWPERLDEYLQGRATAPFSWGTHDCCAFSAGAILAQTGVDIMGQLKARYKTARGAAGFISRNGGSLEAMARQIGRDFGFKEIPVAFAGRGCPVLGEVTNAEGEAEPAMGIVGLDGRNALFASETGCVALPTVSCLAAWGYA